MHFTFKSKSNCRCRTKTDFSHAKLLVIIKPFSAPQQCHLADKIRTSLLNNRIRTAQNLRRLLIVALRACCCLGSGFAASDCCTLAVGRSTVSPGFWLALWLCSAPSTWRPTPQPVLKSQVTILIFSSNALFSKGHKNFSGRRTILSTITSTVLSYLSGEKQFKRLKATFISLHVSLSQKRKLAFRPYRNTSFPLILNWKKSLIMNLLTFDLSSWTCCFMEASSLVLMLSWE